MKSHLFLSLLFGFSTYLLHCQTPPKIDSIQVFTDNFHLSLNDTAGVESFDVSGIAFLNDTSNIKTVVAIIYSVDPQTSIETVYSEIGANVYSLYLTNDNSIPGFFLEDNKIYFILKGLNDIRERYVRFKALGIENNVLDSKSKIIPSINN